MGVVSTLQSVGVLGFGTAAKILIASGGAAAVNKLVGNRINIGGESPDDPNNPTLPGVLNENSNNSEEVKSDGTSKCMMEKISGGNRIDEGNGNNIRSNDQGQLTYFQDIANKVKIPAGSIVSAYRAVASRIVGTGESSGDLSSVSKAGVQEGNDDCQQKQTYGENSKSGEKNRNNNGSGNYDTENKQKPLSYIAAAYKSVANKIVRNGDSSSMSKQVENGQSQQEVKCGDKSIETSYDLNRNTNESQNYVAENKHRPHSYINAIANISLMPVLGIAAAYKAVANKVVRTSEYCSDSNSKPGALKENDNCQRKKISGMNSKADIEKKQKP